MYQKRPMASIVPSLVKVLRVAADSNRLRILLLAAAEELSVAELQEILSMGQSTISTHLSQLKQAGLVEDRRTGKSSLYRLSSSRGAGIGSWLGCSSRRAEEIPEAARTDCHAARGQEAPGQDAQLL
jgi:DNA-binding transcriptional ArsR family regulator